MTFTTSRVLPVIGLLAGIALLTPAPPASAAAPTTPAASIAGVLNGVTITTNSVVATARVPYNGDPLSVFVAWGDGTSSPGALGTPSGSVLVLSHTYMPPPNGVAFTRRVTATSRNDSSTHQVLITPRYAVSHTEELFSPLTRCDSIWESDTEWHIQEFVMRGGSVPRTLVSTREWSFDLPGGNLEPVVPAFYRLAGSSHYVEMTMADPILYIAYNADEKDFTFDDSIQFDDFKLHPSLGSYDGSRIESSVANDCKAELDSDVTVTLLTPQPPPEPVGVPRVPPPPTSPPTPPTCQGTPQNCQEP